MLDEIVSRRSIRQYVSKEVEDDIVKEMIEAAVLSPSAKNRQPWKFIVFRGNAKDELVQVMRKGVEDEKISHRLMPKWAKAIPDAENTVRIMEEAPVLIVVLNTNGKTPFTAIDNEDRIVEICDSLSIGAAIENMILTASEHGLGTLWIANTCFAYDELTRFLDTDDQLIGVVAVGYPDEYPSKRPRKDIDNVLEFREK